METISAREIDRYIFDKNYLLVDVRNPSEYRKQHIRGAVCAAGIFTSACAGIWKDHTGALL